MSKDILLFSVILIFFVSLANAEEFYVEDPGCQIKNSAKLKVDFYNREFEYQSKERWDWRYNPPVTGTIKIIRYNCLYFQPQMDGIRGCGIYYRNKGLLIFVNHLNYCDQETIWRECPSTWFGGVNPCD